MTAEVRLRVKCSHAHFVLLRIFLGCHLVGPARPALWTCEVLHQLLALRSEAILRARAQVVILLGAALALFPMHVAEVPVALVDA